MMSSTTVLSSWLATYFLHSTLLLGSAWLVTRYLPTRLLVVRETLWKVALVGGLITASAQAGLGVEPWGGLLTTTPGNEQAVAVAVPQFPAMAASPSEPLLTTKTSTPGVLEGPLQEAVEPTTTKPGAIGLSSLPSLIKSDRGWLSFLQPIQKVLVVVWALVAAFLLVTLSISYRLLDRRLRHRRELRSGPLARWFGRLLGSIGQFTSKPQVRLFYTPQIDVPLARGLRKREICLPRRVLAELPAEQQELVLAHELAHHKRRDPFWLLAGRVLELVFFFQPLNRLARRRLQEVAEFQCDDWAVEHTGRPISLARCLTHVAEWKLERAADSFVPIAALAVERRRLGRRIERLLERNYPMPAEKRPGWLFGALLVFLVLVIAAAPRVSGSAGYGAGTSPSGRLEWVGMDDDELEEESVAPEVSCDRNSDQSSSENAPHPSPVLAPRAAPADAPSPVAAPAIKPSLAPAPLAAIPEIAVFAELSQYSEFAELAELAQLGELAQLADRVAAAPFGHLAPTAQIAELGAVLAPAGAWQDDSESAANGGWKIQEQGEDLEHLKHLENTEEWPEELWEDWGERFEHLAGLQEEINKHIEEVMNSEMMAQINAQIEGEMGPWAAEMARRAAELAESSIPDPETMARIQALSDDLVARSIPDPETLARIQELSNRMAEDMTPSPELLEKLNEIGQQLETDSSLTLDQRERLRAEARRLAEQARPDREKFLKLREEIQRENRALRPDQEELQQMREEIQRERQELRRQLEKSRPEREEFRRQLEENRRQLERELRPRREEMQRLHSQMRREMSSVRGDELRQLQDELRQEFENLRRDLEQELGPGAGRDALERMDQALERMNVSWFVPSAPSTPAVPSAPFVAPTPPSLASPPVPESSPVVPTAPAAPTAPRADEPPTLPLPDSPAAPVESVSPPVPSDQ